MILLFHFRIQQCLAYKNSLEFYHAQIYGKIQDQRPFARNHRQPQCFGRFFELDHRILFLHGSLTYRICIGRPLGLNFWPWSGHLAMVRIFHDFLKLCSNYVESTDSLNFANSLAEMLSAIDGKDWPLIKPPCTLAFSFTTPFFTRMVPDHIAECARAHTQQIPGIMCVVHNLSLYKYRTVMQVPTQGGVESV